MSTNASVTIDVKNGLTIGKSHLGSLSAPLTPSSPITPVLLSPSPKTDSPDLPSNKIYSLPSVLEQKGYIPLKRISNTLQGSIWKVTKNDSKSDDDTFIIKVADKTLHKHSIAYINGIPIKISENIIKETAILKYLASDNPPIRLIKYHHFFYDEYNYFLVLENGGNSLFYFVKECHQLIKDKVIDINEWHIFCRNAMYQMVDVLDWMHNTMDCCHLDVSLENFTIKNIQTTVMMAGTNKKIIFAPDFQIKLIDFGLAQVFTSKHDNGETDFQSTKYVGKTQYKAPEILGKRHAFDARSADCWSLAVCFFIMFIGVPPCEKASDDDLLYTLIMNGQMYDILGNWNVMDYVSPQILDLLFKLFRVEQYRLTMAQIKQHQWFIH